MEPRWTKEPSIEVEGKFFSAAGQRIFLKGVTYGPFAPHDKEPLGNRESVRRDFSRIASSGINCVRTYTVPEDWFLDLAQRAGLSLLIGVPWEQHVTFLDSSQITKRIIDSVCTGVRQGRNHPAVLGYVLGNEIPASIVRWHGARKIEHFLYRLFCHAKDSNPQGLFTYANYPTTEYLELPFFDFCSYNVYLEDPAQLDGYLRHLQNFNPISPLVITELGVDSASHGEEGQAEGLRRQIATTFRAGCAGAFVFSWTDEWHRGGESIDDWKFGLTTRSREPRPALQCVSSTFLESPFTGRKDLPSASVIICVRNGERTIEQCLRSVSSLRHPSFEIIVVDDGSSDRTLQILEALSCELEITVVQSHGAGLSAARNLGLRTASGDIVAYTDADTTVDLNWLSYASSDLMCGDFAAVGGPNSAPRNVGLMACCVAAAPGWPQAVLISDREAEHIPGCNMAFRRRLLEEIEGFDPQFKTAGDDVDICWRLRENGHKIGYSPSALVWHYPRDSIRAFWRQQSGYGRAETLLERKWPGYHDDLGQISWRGRIYGTSLSRTLGKPRIYHGVWGNSLFQSIYYTSPGHDCTLRWIQYFLLTPEWNMVAVTMVFLASLGMVWRPLMILFPVLMAASAVFLFNAFRLALSSSRRHARISSLRRAGFVTITTFLHFLQPLARLSGRLGRGIRPLLRTPFSCAFPWKRDSRIWNPEWEPSVAILERVESELISKGASVTRGGPFDRWDLELQAGVTGSLRVQLAQEEHPQNTQVVRFRAWPRWSGPVVATVLVFAALSILATADEVYWVAGILAATSLAVALRAILDSAFAAGVWGDTVEQGGEGPSEN